jgi:predicted RNA-binding Zn ribbon-like protein
MKQRQDWAWDGGRPALDLVNTYRDRKTGGREQLAEPADLADWLTRARLTTAPRTTARAVTAHELAEARRLREAISRCVDAVLAGDRCPTAALATLNRWAARHRPPVPTLRQGTPPRAATAPPADPVAAALAATAADAVALLGTDQRDTLRVCAATDCGIRFADRSPAGRRQWCSMRRCGNRAKARAHRTRSR